MATLTRRYTGAVLVDTIRRFATGKDGALHRRDWRRKQLLPRQDLVLHRSGFLRRRRYKRIRPQAAGQEAGGHRVLRLHHQSVLALDLPFKADLVFSIGLVEHFDPEQTRKAVLAHFDASRKGGLVIISFPTPTLLYLAARSIIEALGMWKFPDERPLQREEVVSAVRERGEVAFEKTLWPLIPTQHVVVARSRLQRRRERQTEPFSCPPEARTDAERVPLPAQVSSPDFPSVRPTPSRRPAGRFQ